MKFPNYPTPRELKLHSIEEPNYLLTFLVGVICMVVAGIYATMKTWNVAVAIVCLVLSVLPLIIYMLVLISSQSKQNKIEQDASIQLREADRKWRSDGNAYVTARHTEKTADFEVDRLSLADKELYLKEEKFLDALRNYEELSAQNHGFKPINAPLEKEKDWAVHGGLASGIAGPVAGAVVAAKVMAENEQIRQRNAQMINLSTMLNVINQQQAEAAASAKIKAQTEYEAEWDALIPQLQKRYPKDFDGDKWQQKPAHAMIKRITTKYGNSFRIFCIAQIVMMGIIVYIVKLCS